MLRFVCRAKSLSSDNVNLTSSESSRIEELTLPFTKERAPAGVRSHWKIHISQEYFQHWIHMKRSNESSKVLTPGPPIPSPGSDTLLVPPRPGTSGPFWFSMLSMSRVAGSSAPSMSTSEESRLPVLHSSPARMSSTGTSSSSCSPDQPPFNTEYW